MTHVKACIQQTLLYNALGNQQPREENHASQPNQNAVSQRLVDIESVRLSKHR